MSVGDVELEVMELVIVSPFLIISMCRCLAFDISNLLLESILFVLAASQRCGMVIWDPSPSE